MSSEKCEGGLAIARSGVHFSIIESLPGPSTVLCSMHCGWFYALCTGDTAGLRPTKPLPLNFQ